MNNVYREALIKSLTDVATSLAELAGVLNSTAAASATESRPSEPAAETTHPAKVYTFEEVRAILAEKARNGFRAEVKALLTKRNTEQLSDIRDPKELAELVKEAEGIGIGF